MSLSDLNGDQARQTIDVDQVFSSFAMARGEWARRYRGSMSWKTVGGRDYLYRKRYEAWKSLGPRTPETEAMATRFHEDGRSYRSGSRASPHVSTPWRRSIAP